MRKTNGRLRLGLTDAGKVVLRGTVFVILAALVVPAFGVLSALVSVVLMALLVGFVLRPKIQVSGTLPDRVVVGQRVRLRYVLKNVARLPAYNLCVRLDTLPEAIEQVGDGHVVSRLGPGDTTEVTVEIRPKRRGYYRIKQPICQSSFPFNLFSFGTSHDDEESLIVLPAFSRLQIPLRRLSRHVRGGSARFAGSTGVFPEYAGTRPFLPGDSPRNIDARAWARLSVPATREYHNDFDNYTALVLDTGVPEVLRKESLGLSRSGSNESKEFEAAVSLCASVAFTINNDCLIDLLLTGPELHQFTAWPRMVRLDKIHEILAGVEPSKGYSLEQISPKLANRFYEISEVFFILLSWDKAYRQSTGCLTALLELAGKAGCHCTVLMIGDSSRMNMDEDNVSWTENVRFLSPDDILTGQIKRL
ncbi:MAG: DUF58 domain-containing protein [Planctomycetes bacterium]|nr:DUF58 domain-containing protein [Planctomycetota bacterium]